MAVDQVHVVATGAEENLAFPLAALLFARGALPFGIATVRVRALPTTAGGDDRHQSGK